MTRRYAVPCVGIQTTIMKISALPIEVLPFKTSIGPQGTYTPQGGTEKSPGLLSNSRGWCLTDRGLAV